MTTVLNCSWYHSFCFFIEKHLLVIKSRNAKVTPLVALSVHSTGKSAKNGQKQDLFSYKYN